MNTLPNSPKANQKGKGPLGWGGGGGGGGGGGLQWYMVLVNSNCCSGMFGLEVMHFLFSGSGLAIS